MDGRSRYASCLECSPAFCYAATTITANDLRAKSGFLLLSFQYFQYVVVSSKKILFYNDEQDKEQSNPSMVLDIE